ncbi:MAG: hypothetical protein H8E66_23030 [Planctomycetes bacterium]|nr:hypothetical protein [Planctomycetota bacterium]
MLARRNATTAVAVCAVTLFYFSDVTAQEAAVPAPSGPQRVIRGPDGKPMIVRPGQPPMPVGGAKPASTPAKPGSTPAKPDEKKKEEGDKAEDSKTVTHPTEPPEKPNPDELKVKPDGDGLLRFNFRYQPWPEVLEWLAGVSKMSLAWRELPGGFLNLSTQRSYSVEEARDLINWHLLSHGFTLLHNGEILSVEKTSGINSGMVPRVAADQLEELMPHEFAKVSFELDWLLAEAAVEELTPMKSPNGTLTALKSTNRIEAMDAVINLREIYNLLQQEQSESGQDNLIQEFVLEHARATDVLTSLQELLGLESKKAATPMTPQQMQLMQQQMQQMQRSSGGKTPPKAAPKPAEVHLIVNSRKNSVVAHAAPDKMAIIEKAVEALDVATSHRDGLLNKPFQIHAYRLHSLSPAPLVKTLQDVGDLDPNTRLEADEKSNSIVAYASLVDHTTIQQLIDNLDGSGREFDVIPLRRLSADYVAGTIEFMMIGEKEEEQQSSRYYGYSYSSRYGNNEEKKDDDEFRVDADIENNMLLLWANEIEIESVRQLLVKLGEIPPEGGRTSKMRVMNAVPPEEAAKFLERLRQAWPSLGPNQLNLPTLPKEEETPEPATPPREPEAKEVRRHGGTLTLAVFDASEKSDEEAAELDGSDGPPPAKSEPTAPPSREELRRRFLDGQRKSNATPPPINISIDPSGRLVITSEDTDALDLLEELVSQLAPRAPDYKMFKLQYVDAYYVKDNLEDFFKEEDDDNSNSSRRYYYYDYSPQKDEKSRSRLSQRPELKFIYDYDSNSILVQGASESQLATIEELIAIYDKPKPEDSQSARLFSVFQIEYSSAAAIAESIKEVYRDLLSSNDKALQQGNPESKGRQQSGTTYVFNEGGDNKPDRTHLSFKGKLSIGIDQISNVLLVSAEGEPLMNAVKTMVETLDEAAKPVASVSVVKLGGNLNAEKVRAVLSGLLGDKQAAAQAPGQNPQPNAQGGNQPRGGNKAQNGVAAPRAQ